MRKILIILCLLISITVDATIRWVTPRGNDSNTGADSSSTGAWASWGKAFQTAVAGDTVYFRGGIYYITSSSQFGNIANHGSPGNYINFWAYPPDYKNGNFPILDFSRYVAANYTYAVRAYNGDDYLHFKGLTIRNLFQSPGTGYVAAMHMEISDFLIIEDMNIHHISGPCIGIYGGNEVYIKNCDTWESCDSLATNPGQNGTGIAVNTWASLFGEEMYDAKIYIDSCRTWACSDQGIALAGVGHVEVSNTWTFANGRLNGEGFGMKLSIQNATDSINPLARYVHNNIIAINAGTGIDPNNAGGLAFNAHVYNNFLYRQGHKPWVPYYINAYIGAGIWICNYLGPPASNEMYANNLGYDNDKGDVVDHDTYIHEYNSWDQPGLFTVGADDFVSLDTLQLWYPRNADGTLPDITFGKLKSTSDLIDKGINVGLPYIGTAPDLGWFESGTDSTDTNILTFVFSQQTEAATIDTAAHTVEIEVTWDADITDLTPTITMSYGATISPLSGVSQDFTSPVVYTVTALDETTTQEWTVTVTQETQPVPTGHGFTVKYRGKIVKR